MFSFGIWDVDKKILFLSRDRAGQKPLYYAASNGNFAFASQLKALRALPGFPWDINYDAVNAYLGLGYIPGEMALYFPAKKLPPAHSAVYDFEKGSLEIWQYWQLPQFAGNKSDASLDDFVYNLERLIDQSVSLRLEADVPVGVLLSGGVDSSILAAVAAKRKGGKQVKTFCIKMDDPSLDESANARRVAEYLGTEHHELSASPASLEMINDLVDACDEPIADSSILPTYVLSRLVREHVTVALGGDGGDEIFGGYNHYSSSLQLVDKMRFVPPIIMKLFGCAAGKFIPVGVRGRNFLASLRDGAYFSSIRSNTFFDPWARNNLLNDDVKKRLKKGFLYPEQQLESYYTKSASHLYNMQKTDYCNYLPEDILAKVDRASMAVSLEVRAPWLDFNVAEYSFINIHDKFKVNDSNRRIVQAKLAQKLLPGVIDTKRKQGFSIPLDSWLRKKAEMNFIKETILQSKLLELTNKNEINGILKGQLNGRCNSARVFSLYMLALVLNKKPNE
jgi:asparagine synthase (glutamine-hydrolysing)